MHRIRFGLVLLLISIGCMIATYLQIGSNRRKSINKIYSLKDLPLIYQKMLKRPIAYPNCGVNSKMQPWFALSENVDMLFLIKSAPQNIKLRNFIRKTWASISSVHNMKFASIFLVGQPAKNLSNADEKNKLLLEENQIFGDLLQCEYQDSYRSLPIKVLSSFQWVLSHYVIPLYYTVTDDDCLMDLLNIDAYFQQLKKHNVVYCGYKYGKNYFPVRDKDAKIYLDDDTYSSKVLPPFCHGGMYTMRRSLLKELYDMAELTERNGFHLEDVFITGILREKLGFGNKNLKPVLSKTKKNFAVMYYYANAEDEQDLFKKLSMNWQQFNATLPWASMKESEPLMTVLERNVDTDLVKSIILKWKQF